MPWLRIAIREECSYCKRHLGDKEPLSDDAVSHGICQSCLKFVEYESFGEPLPDGATPEDFQKWKAQVKYK